MIEGTTFGTAGLAFEEKQRVELWWIKLISWSCAFISFAAIYVITKEALTSPCHDAFGMPLALVVIMDLICLVSGVLCIFAVYFTLHTQVSMDRLIIRLWPIKHLEIMISDIVSWEITQYRPIAEYGGWGMRRSFKTGIRAYTMAGNRGLCITLNTGEKILLGSQRPEQLAQALERMKNN